MPEVLHSFSFDAGGGTFCIRAGDDLVLSGASVQALLGDRNLTSVVLDASGIEARDGECPGLGPGRRQTVRFADDAGLAMAFEAFVPRDGRAVVLKVAISNGSSVPVRVDELQPLVLESEAGDLQLGMPSSEWVVLREGWHSGSPSGARSLADTDFDAASDERPAGFTGTLVAVLAARDTQRGLLLGWLDARRQFGHIVWGKRGDGAWLRAAAMADGVPLEPGATLESEPLLVRFTDDPLAALEDYGRLLARRMDSRVLDARAAPSADEAGAETPAKAPSAVTGWASWHTGLGHTVSDAAIRDNLKRYAAEADRWRLDAWVIDDGWQSVAGDWLIVNDRKFPRGMKLAADGIRQAGLRPGLWVAPLLASEVSVLAREHVDWLLKDERGEVVTAFEFAEDSHWRGRQFVLDVTHPEAADHLRRVVRTIVRDWGFALVKADLLFVAALPGARHDPTVSRCQAVRRALEILRDEVGQRFLLAGGCPIGPAVGLADACRTGPETAPYWDKPELSAGAPAVRNAVRNSLARYWQHGRLFLADPGAVMVRRTDSDLTQAEVETLATVAAMSGGLVMWSDLLDAVSEDRRLILDKVLPVWPEAARPVHLLKNELTQTLVWTFERGRLRWHVVALVNLSDQTTDLSLRLTDAGCAPGAPHHVFELWREAYHGTVEDEVTLPAVPPHGTRLLALRPVTGGLDFLASTLHVTMDALLCRVEPKGLACDVTLEASWRRGGRLFFGAPPGYVVRTSDGLLTERDDGCWSIEVDTSLTTEYHLEALHQRQLQ